MLKGKEFEVIKLDRNNVGDINACLDLYNKQPQHILRTSDNFYNHVISWNCEPYIVKVADEIIGYYSIKDNNHICECVFKKKCLDTMLKACLADRNEVYIELPYSLYSNELVSKVDMYEVQYNLMYNVLNLENVKTYLDFDDSKTVEFDKMSKKDKFRALLGCDEFPAKYSKLNMFFYNCDQG